jgi:hypothetical protein
VFDVLGDVVCGGFAPIREGYAEKVRALHRRKMALLPPTISADRDELRGRGLRDGRASF